MQQLLFLPDGLQPWVAIGLVGASLVASLVTATLGLGGGILMLSIMSLAFPPAILIPLHGAIQLGSNAGRAVVQRAHIQWQMVLWISLGAILGSAVGVRFAALLPENVFMVAIALFILSMTWLPRPDVQSRGPVVSFVGGAVIAFTGMIVGVTGPLVMTFIRAIGDRQKLIATHAMLMTFQNITKIVAFVVYGFVFTKYIPLVGIMIVAGFIGTVLGSRLLLKLPEKAFRQAFRIIVTVIAVDLLRRAFFSI